VTTVTDVQSKPTDKGDTSRVIPGIDEYLVRASAEQKMLHELGVPWAVPGKTVDLRSYRRFAGPNKD
jgi:hypothetical protein